MHSEFQKIRIFLGCPLSSHLKLQLSRSIGWKNALIVGQATSQKLVELAHEGQDYIGLYLPEKVTELSDLKKIYEETLKELIVYTPDLDVKKSTFVLFPQIFVN